ncbi:MAG: glutathione peroxidase [Planctomycetota bacterium]|nr:MAG: glutathione peroxidase [Planctomycetota bacterium]
MIPLPIAIGIGLTITALIVGSCRSKDYGPVDTSQSVHDFTMTTISGEEYPLKQHAGKIMLIVNTASKCGFTKQYKGLEALHQEYKDQGLVVIGVPSADFMNQEFAEDSEIAEFCEINFGVTFDLMSRESVRGDEAHPLFTYLTTASHHPGRISWNFNKFLINGQGHVISRYGSRSTPESLRPDIAAALESQTGQDD